MKKDYTFMDEARHYAGQAARNIKRANDMIDVLLGTGGPKGQVGKIEQLKEWIAIMLPCFVWLLCGANVLTAVVEIYIQQPIWQCLSPDDLYVGWLGAIAMVIVGAYISHCFAKFFVGELREWWMYMRMNRTDRPDLEDVRTACQQDTQRDTLKGLIILLPTAWWVYHLTWLRVELEAQAAGMEPVFTPLDWLPTVVYVLNATVMGVFWEYVFKKQTLVHEINKLENTWKAIHEAAEVAAQKTNENYRAALDNKEPGSANPPKEVRNVLDWYNKTTGLNHNMGLIESLENETLFVFYNDNQPLKSEPILVSLDDNTQLPVLYTDQGGIVPVRWNGTQLSISHIRLLHKEVLVTNGPWLPGTLNKIDISGQLPKSSLLSLN